MRRKAREYKRALAKLKEDPFNPDLWDAVDPKRAEMLRARHRRRDATMALHHIKRNPPPVKKPKEKSYDELATDALMDDNMTDTGTLDMEALFDSHFDGGL